MEPVEPIELQGPVYGNRDTYAFMLGWLMYLRSEHPPRHARDMEEEIQDHFGVNEAQISSDVAKLKKRAYDE